MVLWLYGSPMIHKEGMPLHPIVNYMGSMVYKTSKAIADLPRALTGKTEYHIKDNRFQKEY